MWWCTTPGVFGPSARWLLSNTAASHVLCGRRLLVLGCFFSPSVGGLALHTGEVCKCGDASVVLSLGSALTRLP